MSAHLLFVTALETLLNQALRLDTVSTQALTPLAGKSITFEIKGVGLDFTLFPEVQSVTVVGHYEGTTDASISGAPFTLLRLLVQPNVTLATTPDITLSGDVNLAQQFWRIISGLKIDWEGHLSQWLGDSPARKLGDLVRRTQHFAQDHLQNLQQNISGYLQEESCYLPTPAELDTFTKAVNMLHDDLDRLEQRVRRLQKQLL